MAEEFFSPSWYRVAQLRPRIRSDARVRRHRYRGRSWYVLQDPASGRCHRLTPGAWHVVGRMDGARTAQQIWEATCVELGDEAPTQEETLRLLGLLHAADLLLCDVSPDLAELFRRAERRRGQETWQRFANPLALRLPLLDPEAFLTRWLPLVRPLFSRAALAVWLAVVAVAGILAVMHAPALTRGLAEQLLAPSNLLLMALLYPLLKGLHELGHAFAVRVFGGEVHEMGVIFLVGIPVPYVDASAASIFPEKGRRIVVGAAGIAVELFVAALALFVWLAAEPGWLQRAAFDLVWIGGASSLLFNGNPLLRFDGYYVLADAIEIPNLAARSRAWFTHQVLHRAFGLESSRSPAAAPGEAFWLAGYGVASFVYRIGVLLAIALFVASRFFALGVALALFALATQLLLPMLRQVGFLLTSPRLGAQRPRALTVSTLAVVLGALALGAVPLPHFTLAEGVVWPPEGSEVRAEAEGFVARVLVPPGAEVGVGAPLLELHDPALEAELAVLAAQVNELRAREHAEQQRDRVRAQITGEELVTLRAELARARQRAAGRVVRSPAAGSFVTSQAEDLVGRFVEQGALLGHVLGPAVAAARVVLPQSDVALVRGRTQAISVRVPGRLGRELEATVRRWVPAASDRLPSPALGSLGGGPFAVDPEEPSGLRTLETVFHLELALPEHAGLHEIGGRVYVRFDHGREPLARRGWRALRRLFLSRLAV